jgi:hypothetical protein
MAYQPYTSCVRPARSARMTLAPVIAKIPRKSGEIASGTGIKE